MTGERDVYLEEVKDLALALYSRDRRGRGAAAHRRRARFRVVDAGAAAALAARYDLDYLVVERDVDLPVAYRNETVSRVYSLQAGVRRYAMTSRSRLRSPLPRWKGGHWMTVYAWGKPRTFPALPPPQPRLFDVAPGTRVLAHCHWQPRPWEHPTLIALHGLESSSDAHYVRGLADKAFAAGFNAVRLNQRNCGATEHLSDSLYHSGLTGDPIAVMRELIDVDGLTAFAIAGYSLGGNLTLKLAGDFGANPPKELCAVCAVSPTMDLAVCVDALEEKAERDLSVALRQESEAPHAPQSGGVARQVDARCAAAHQHRSASSTTRTRRRFTAFRTPPTTTSARARCASSTRSASRRSSSPPPTIRSCRQARSRIRPSRETDNITLKLTPHGGHCGFVEESRAGYDGYWAEREIVRFLKSHCR